MSCLTTNDAAMKALSAHFLKIEPESPAADSAHNEPEDSYDWFFLEPPTYAERYPTKPLILCSHNEEQIHNEWWIRNGEVDEAAAAEIAKQNEKAVLSGENLTEAEVVKAEVKKIREKHRRRRRRKVRQRTKQKGQEELEELERQKELEKQKELEEQKKQQQLLETVENQDIMDWMDGIESIVSIPSIASSSELVTQWMSTRGARNQLVSARKEYESAYEQNLIDLEFGPSCQCLRTPWQYEVLPLKALWGTRWGAGKEKRWGGY